MPQGQDEMVYCVLYTPRPETPFRYAWGADFVAAAKAAAGVDQSQPSFNDSLRRVEEGLKRDAFSFDYVAEVTIFATMVAFRLTQQVRSEKVVLAWGCQHRDNNNNPDSAFFVGKPEKLGSMSGSLKTIVEAQLGRVSGSFLNTGFDWQGFASSSGPYAVLLPLRIPGESLDRQSVLVCVPLTN